MRDDLWQTFHMAPNERAIVQRGDETLSAGDIRAEAARLCTLLGEERTPVFLYCEDAGNFLAGFLAAIAAGREVRLPGHTAPGFLREIGAVGSLLLSDVAGLGDKTHRVSVTRGAASAPAALPLPDHASRVSFFTSGSTGEPKPCEKTLGLLLTEVRIQIDLWGAPKGPVVGTVSHQHIYGLLFRVLWPLVTGELIVGSRQETWEDVARALRPGSPLISSPAHLSRIPDGLALPQPSLILSSGGPLSLGAARSAVAALGSCPVEILGSTETGGVAWRRQDVPDALWTALPQVEIKPDEEGALCVRSPFTGIDGYFVMGDQVELAADGRFALRLRLDRIVKVEGKRVSLPRVEQALRDLGEIADASAIDLPQRNGALGAVVVLAPDGEKRLKEMGRFRYSRRIRQALAERLEPMERPRYWRFVSHIPENAQGKRAVAELRALFMGTPQELPTITDREIGEEEARFELELDPALRWFEGHFPSQPILPGVAQLHIAVLMAEKAWGHFATGSEMSRVKFRRVMRPGDRVTLVLQKKGAARIDFRYVQGDEIVASGAIKGGGE